MSDPQPLTPAEAQFYASSVHPCPPGYTPWKIRLPPLESPVDQPPPEDEATWLKIPLDGEQNYRKYLKAIQDYCFKGMIGHGEHDFDPWKNTDRNWYNAPWLHPGPTGREPLHGLRSSGRYIPPYEISVTQHRYIQKWEAAFFNSAAASVFTEVWKKPSEPDWKKDIRFPLGTVRFEVVYTDATDEELPNLKGSPSKEAMIAVRPSDPTVAPDPRNRLTDEPARVRLLQMDIAVRDDRGTESGWVFTTFTYDGTKGDGYDGVIPVGLSWGLNPEVNQEAYENGAPLDKTWINPDVEKLRERLQGYRPFWGWNGRLAGAGDGFISACQSCHARAQWNPTTKSQGVGMVPPEPVQDGHGKYVPVNDTITMSWFKDEPGGKPITKGAISADCTYQFLIGYENYTAWRAKHPDAANN